jgi:hypothetical protein
VPHDVPRPPADFVGREAELRELVDAVQRGASILELYGLPGIGKRAVALKLAEILTAEFPDGQLYFDLSAAFYRNWLFDQEHTIAAAMAYVIRSYDHTAQIPNNEAELAARYRTVLADKRALILMENVADPRQVEPLIPPTGCVMLITSRVRFVLPTRVYEKFMVLALRQYQIYREVVTRTGS